MTQCLFIRLVAEDDKETALAAAVQAIREGRDQESVVFPVDPSAFSQVPGSPFAYWASDRIRRLFSELPPFEGDGRTVRVGLQTSDDTRFVRAWWEVAPERIVTGTPETTPEGFRRQTFAGKRWVPFAKGGEYSPYYADLHLVVNWERDGEELQAFSRSVIRNPDFYFRPGLTWPRRTTSGISFRILPPGSIFADQGPAAFLSNPLLFLGLAQSMPFSAIIQLQVGAADKAARSYQVGVIQNCPIPLVERVDRRIQELVRESIDLKLKMALADETTHVFSRPSVLMLNGPDLVSRAVKWTTLAEEWMSRLSDLQREVDQLVADAYGVPIEEWESLTANLEKIGSTFDEEDEPEDENAEVLAQPPDGVELSNAIADVLSYVLGAIFGRWDIRLATGQRPMPELPDPFAPLPVCSPGMLTGPTGLPARPEEVPPDYPIPIQWDGIIPDDEGHPRDLIAQVHRVFGVLFPDRDPREVEAEACAILGARDLRSWFANQFFQYHIKRYSKSRRKAPIYWQLRSARKSYSIWLYYHRLTGDTLWTVLRNYVDPKLEHEQQVLAELKAKLEVAQKAGHGREERRLVREVQKQEQLLEELTQFRADIYEVASMGYEPDRDDGVLINIAPLHKLVPWPEAARAWRELQEGKYPWSTMHKGLGIGNRRR